MPGLVVLINSLPISTAIEAEVSLNRYFAAGRFRLRAALDASGAALWSNGDLQVEIQMGLDGAWTSMMVGQADRVEIDPIRGEVLVDGRDLSARLQAARTQETFENRTASEIATVLAARHGLAASVTATTARVGRNYQNGYARTTLNQYSPVTTEWDLLTRLAEAEGFDVWVDGQTLNFAPDCGAVAAIQLTPQDCIGLRLERTTSLEGALQVLVKSWDCRGVTTINQSATRQAAGSDTTDAAMASYIIVRPNLAADAAQSLAERVLNQMTQHARSISIEMPGELLIAPRAAITLAQTGTSFDGTYEVSSIERRISFRHGFSQSVQARSIGWTAS
jgi:phage protein D